MSERDLLLCDSAPAMDATVKPAGSQRALGVVALGIFAVLATTALTYWSFIRLQPPTDQTSVGALGTALGIGGMLSAFLGFGLTLWQLIRTSRSAEAAAQAVNAVKRDFGSFDAMAELSSAKGLNEAIRLSLAARDREAAKARYDRLRESLIKLASAPHALRTQVSSKFKDQAASIIDALNALREIEDENQIPWNEMITFLEELDSYLISVSQTLRESIRG
jgi:hypothetical protein